MAESRVRIGTEGPLSPDEVAHRSFATTRRGFDPSEVQSFLAKVAAELTTVERYVVVGDGDASALASAIQRMTASMGESPSSRCW